MEKQKFPRGEISVFYTKSTSKQEERQVCDIKVEGNFLRIKGKKWDTTGAIKDRRFRGGVDKM